MGYKRLPFQSSEATVSLRASDLDAQAQGWLLDCEYRQLSAATCANRRGILQKLQWFARQQEYEHLGAAELRAFFLYVAGSTPDPAGRWGRADLPAKARPGTTATYYRVLKTFFEWLSAEGLLIASPMQPLKPPVDRPDQIQPLAEAEVKALMAAAKRSRHRLRDEALLLFLLDTGCRASEAAGLRIGDLDLGGKRVTVDGKGGKRRSVYFGPTTTRALWRYLQHNPADPDAALFRAESGHTPGAGITRSGVFDIVQRLARAARLSSACFPHRLRHTFAISFLRAGGNVFTLKEMLGHTSLAIVNRYVALAQADIANQHRQFSPVERMRNR